MRNYLSLCATWGTKWQNLFPEQELKETTDVVRDRSHCAKAKEISENELLGLHEGNFARYRIAPAEFEAWRKV